MAVFPCRRRSIAPSQFKRHLNAHLVLDLDHTLLCSESNDRGWVERVVLRPHVSCFLEWAFNSFQTVSLFSAAQSNYIDVVLPLLGSWPWACVWSGLHCRNGPAGTIVKPLQLLWDSDWGRRHGATMYNTIMVDDLPESYQLTPSNGLQIPTFDSKATGHIHDRELLSIIPRIHTRLDLLHSYHRVVAQHRLPVRLLYDDVPTTDEDEDEDEDDAETVVLDGQQAGHFHWAKGVQEPYPGHQVLS